MGERAAISRRELEGNQRAGSELQFVCPVGARLAQAAAGGGEPEGGVARLLAGGRARRNRDRLHQQGGALGTGTKPRWRRSSVEELDVPFLAGFTWRQGTRRRPWTRPSPRRAEPSSV